MGAGGSDPGLSPEVEACLRVNACEADGGTPVGIQACLGHAYERQWRWASSGEYRMGMDAMDCRLAAEDCEGVRACDTDPADFTADCAEHIGESLCVGEAWVLCDFEGGAAAAFDCSAKGEQCNMDIWAGCGTEPCTFGQTEAVCDADNPDVLVQCAPSGFIERVDCTKENNFVIVHAKEGDEAFTIAGQTCGDDPMLGSKGCIGTGASCEFFSQECDGDTLITCAGGALSERDCSALDPADQGCGFVTEGPFGGGAACGIVASDCDPSADESCAAGVISFCAQGKQQTIVCAENGYSDCANADQVGRTIAFCTQ